MTQRRLTTVGLAAALLLAAAIALAGSASATPTPGKSLTVEELGPKYLLGKTSPRIPSINATTRAMLDDEFGPKYLLGYELKAARAQALASNP